MKSVPLGDGDIDIAILSLSLMGRNWPKYIAEAKRCLTTNGYLLVVETTNVNKGTLSKLKTVIEKYGFELYKEEERGNFTFIEVRVL